MKKQAVILFDGVCNLCNSSIDFILKRDRNDLFLVGPLQDNTARELVRKYNIREDYLDSLILIEDGKAYFKSTGALRISRHLSGLWPIFYPLIIIPSVLRDPIYDWIARNRYKWFGQKSTCRIPTEQEAAKFISGKEIAV